MYMFKVNSRRVNYILLKGTLQLFVYELFMKLFKLYTLRVHHNLYTIYNIPGTSRVLYTIMVQRHI